ncbi:calcium-binding protein [Stagnihabitans tardus]|uniref:Calcium-binding protein n=1 Tax=Stagnihabitans tardus TaxID=2699202 RepID=A0AAE4YAJ0_9RHOB|nr:calcium-binding protein [Stagnihabitans tardus]NBZ86025.1 hypothetical protein [Stagnihabitans tardus]
MSIDLSSIPDALAADPGLAASVSGSDLAQGLAAATTLSNLLAQTLDGLGANADGLISVTDIQAVSATIQADPGLFAQFQLAHGDDASWAETGFHLLQGDGGSLTFKGRNFVDTVADGMFHFGFATVGGKFLNEDGALSRTVEKVAAWVNYFVNGVVAFQGTAQDDRLESGAYSAVFTGAEHELWLMGAGNDRVSAGIGNDTIHGGMGSDALLGDGGNDSIMGEAGADLLQGGAGADSLYGGADADRVLGGEGADLLSGGDGADFLRGGTGADSLYGGAGADRLLGEEGADLFEGGAGADRFVLTETVQACDVIVLRSGDSGATAMTADLVQGFVSGIDKIDLTDLGPISFETGGFSASGASAHYDGLALRIDTTGDGTCDMMIRFQGLATLSASDLLLV